MMRLHDGDWFKPTWLDELELIEQGAMRLRQLIRMALEGTRPERISLALTEIVANEAIHAGWTQYADGDWRKPAPAPALAEGQS